MRGLLTLGMVAIQAMTAASALEIKTAPADYLYTVEGNARRGYMDLMVQTIVIQNDDNTPATLTALQLDLFGANGQSLSKNVPVDGVVASTQQFAGMQAQGLGVFLNAQLLSEAGPEAALGEGASLAGSPALNADEYLVSTGHYLAADFTPTQLVITASYLTAEGAPKTARRSLEVRQREQSIDYSAPVEGNWFVSGIANLDSHHRFLPSNEFALDFFRTGPDGVLDEGDKYSAEDDYGHGDPVLAAADGEVVFVIDDQAQNADELTRRDGESIDDARQRVTLNQFRRFAEDFRAAAAGNMIVLRHEQGGAVEYSAYGHLKEGGVAVKVGDRVRQGDVIGAVGNTGDSTLTHLHFQLNDTPDAFFTRSLPVTFTNAEPRYMGAEPGVFMIFEE